MTQFHAHRVANGPLVLDLQSDLIDTGTRVVAPLIRVGAGPTPLPRLEPVFEIAGVPHALHTAEMAAIPARLLETPAVAAFTDRDYDIRRALDMVFSGF